MADAPLPQHWMAGATGCNNCHLCSPRTTYINAQWIGCTAVQRSQKLELQVCPPDCRPLRVCKAGTAPCRYTQTHYTVFRPNQHNPGVFERDHRWVYRVYRGEICILNEPLTLLPSLNRNLDYNLNLSMFTFKPIHKLFVPKKCSVLFCMRAVSLKIRNNTHTVENLT